MRAIPLILIFSFILNSLNAQNLVPNPGIEFYNTVCDNYIGDFWFSPNGETTDFLGVCNGQVPTNFYGDQPAYEGSAYGGIRLYISPSFPYINYREYLSVKLLSPLVAGYVYNVSMRYSIADLTALTTDRLGICVTVDSLGHTNLFGSVPQISNPLGNYITNASSWDVLSGSFTATGGERYLTIGNFYNDNSTSVILFSATPDVHVNHSVYLYVDDVKLIVDSTSIPPPEDFLIPNLVTINSDNHNDAFSIKTNKEYDAFEVNVFNIWGNRVYYSNEQDFQFDQFSTAGVYYYLIKINNTREYKGWVHVIKE